MPIERQDARIMACPAIRLSVEIRGPLVASPYRRANATRCQPAPGSFGCSVEDDCEFARGESCLLTLLEWERSTSTEPSR
jgi:hypothetical protein